MNSNDEDDERPPCTQQNSSLGISQALKSSPRHTRDDKSNLRDDSFREAAEHDSILGWSRFYVSLYYNKMAVGMFGCFTGWQWYNRIDETIILGALPTPSHIKELHSREGVSAVVNLCAEFPGYKDLYKELHIRQIRLPTTDFTIPDLASIEIGLDTLMEIIESQKGSVYVHCKAGRGRSAAFAICYLLRRYRLNPPEAQNILLHCRPQVDKDLFQADEIRMYYKDLISLAESGRITRIPFPDTLLV
ncbi:protein-tyrosine phosphatase-like protein [Syncephalastrum racemosum]|uniref:Protein-tyrosine phosphatase-like protein n=1 Tax=Syncephalastrum racemosum TaxID=13706 RepID=A0A1X2HIX2_SYNRA|nr:protein-tyrosine phosphatase-like protein [Syncephalastrum racemosum]